MAGYRAVLFDFFGTLTHAVTRGHWHQVVAHNLGCDPDSFLTALDRSYRARCRGAFASPHAALRWICDQLGADPTPQQLRAAVRARVAAVRADTRLRVDALTALGQVHARGLRTAVVSDCAHELPLFLPQLAVAPLLDACAFSIEVGHCKPDPALYLAACDRLGVEPSECLYLGDGDSQELTGADALGMTAVRLAAADLANHLVFDPDRDFHGRTAGSLTEAVSLLDQLPLAPPRAIVQLARGA